MNEAQVKNIITLILSIVGGILTAKGLLTTDQVNQTGTAVLSVVGPLMTLVGLVWGIINHTATNQISSTSKLSEVRRVVTNDEVALKVSRPNVVSGV